MGVYYFSFLRIDVAIDKPMYVENKDSNIAIEK